MKKTNIKLILSLTGENFSPIDFSSSIGLQATNSWFKNEPVPNRTSLYRKDSAWEYQIGPIEDLSIDQLISSFIEIIGSVQQGIIEYLQTNNLVIKCDLIVEIYDEEKPSVFFESKFIEILASMKAVLDVDLYHYTN
jgi:hypothetical protein